MIPNVELRLRALRAGLLFCSEDHQPVIQAMIDQLITANTTSEYPEERSGTAREAPSTGIRDGTASPAVQTQPAASVGVQPAAPHHPTGDWRAARRQLRQAGDDVQQVDGIVYIDGRRSDDLGLYPS